MNSHFREYLLEATSASACEEIELIQSLWSGYGKISRYRLADSRHKTVVVKHIAPMRGTAHPRGWSSDFSHSRKLKSYRVETLWYEQWSEACSAECRLPKFLGSFSEVDDCWIILEDLDEKFPVKKDLLDVIGVKVCLKWLAHFHARFMGRAPKGLWEVGTYWHLATRPDEFEKIEHQELKAKAHRMDELLNSCRYKTIVHGDAKVANFCFSENGDRVAAVDFQYVGGGCGMKDVAYLMGSCLSGSECEKYEDELLEYYFDTLRLVLERSEPRLAYTDLESEWRKMYPVASADFSRFLMGWMPAHQKLNDYSLKLMQSVLLTID